MRTVVRSSLLLLTIGSHAFAVDSRPDVHVPALIIYISVDQMREDYFTRYGALYTGGLRSLHDEGAFFADATLNYASSVTCLGHATLATGCYPNKSGILENEWIDPRTRKPVYCVEDSTAEPVDGEGGGVSPRNLQETGIGDWLKSVSPSSRVISISGKDRAAILMGGVHPDAAYWYSGRSGHMVSSSYYLRRLPVWVRDFNASAWVDKNVPDAWDVLLPPSVYRSVPDSVDGESRWNGSIVFPHSFKEGTKSEQLLGTPFGDQLVLAFALQAVKNEELGQRDTKDLLCISLSSTDYIGHAFGPDSREMMDQMLRLDRSLGEFLASVRKLLRERRFVVVLSADHGVLPLPEILRAHGDLSARRIDYASAIKHAVDSINAALENQYHVAEPLIDIHGFLNYRLAATAGVDSLGLEALVRKSVGAIDGIADIYFRRELMNGATPTRPYLAEFRRSYYPTLGEDFEVRFCEGCLVTSSKSGTSHGSVYRYDTHVPVVFWGGSIPKENVAREIHTVDIAPTIARLYGIPYPPDVDGRPLQEALSGK